MLGWEKGASFIMTKPGLEDVVGYLTHKPGLNIVRTAVQIRDSAQYSEKLYYVSLPKVLISPACENSLG